MLRRQDNIDRDVSEVGCEVDGTGPGMCAVAVVVVLSLWVPLSCGYIKWKNGVIVELNDG
jgi:hypothetical protein